MALGVLRLDAALDCKWTRTLERRGVFDDRWQLERESGVQPPQSTHGVLRLDAALDFTWTRTLECRGVFDDRWHLEKESGVQAPQSTLGRGKRWRLFPKSRFEQ
jgi:hypothetical protein